jgi:ferredoxin--NADP+ reductase
MENATIIKKIEVTPELLIIRVKPDAGVPDFQSGQYVALGLMGSVSRLPDAPPEKSENPSDKIIKRAYSIGSSPECKEYLEFYIAVVADGSLTSRLVTLNEGDRLFCAPKITGTFTLSDVPSEKNLVLVSTGTGLAPFISMLKTPSTWNENRKISLLHGVRYSKDLAYKDELETFVRENPNFSYYPVVSRETPTNNEFTKGYVQHLFSDGTLKLDSTKDHIFLCGNPAMIEDVEKMLVQQSFIVHSKKTPGNLHLEKYW